MTKRLGEIEKGRKKNEIERDIGRKSEKGKEID